MEKTLICVACPMGCQINVDMQDNEVLKITGNTCKRGEKYAYTESTSPARSLTSTVKVAGGKASVVPVKSAGAVPKKELFGCMEEINKVCVNAPVKIGDIVIKNILDTGIDIVATNNVEKA